jgi:ribosomal protein S3
LVGVAVKVTLVPEQIVVALATTDTDAGRSGLTVIVMPDDVAGDPVKHGLAFEVS